MSVAFDLAGRRILVFGASSGVGRAVGELASAAGARVAFAARRSERLEEAVAKTGGRGLAVACDVRRGEECARAVAETVAAFGGLDAFVYATGMSPLVMLEQATSDEWREVLDTNLVGAALVAAQALPHLKQSAGRAVFVSSYAVRQCLPGVALYRVSKVALDALIEGWRMEHPDVEFTRVVLGNTGGTEFAAGWGGKRTHEITQHWVERNLFPAPTMMPLEVAAEGILSVLAVRGYVDDIAIMPHVSHSSAVDFTSGRKGENI